MPIATTSFASARETADVFSAALVPADFHPQSTDFAAQLGIGDLGDGLAVTRLRTRPVSVDRHGSHLVDPDGEHLVFGVNFSGRSRVFQGPACSPLDGLSATAVAADRPSTLSVDSDGELILLSVPRHRLALTDRVLAGALSRVHTPSSPQLRVVGAFLRTVCEEVDGDPAVAGAWAAVALDLIAGLLAEPGRSAERPQDPGLQREMLRFVAHSCADPELSVTTLADRFSVSERYVYRLFADLHDTPARAVHRARAEYARRLLSGSGATVAAVAGLVGYRDVTTFTRAFRRETGVTPGQWRVAHRAAG